MIRQYPEHAATVVETVEIAGRQVDIIAHTAIHATTIDEPVTATPAVDYEAALAGQYELVAPEVSYRDEATSWAAKGAAQTWRRSQVRGDGASLGESGSIAGAKSAARRNLETRRLLETYGPVAQREVAVVAADVFDGLPAEERIKPGDLVVAWGHGRYRRAVAVAVGAKNVRYLFSTPSGQGHLSFGTGRPGDQVRLASRVASVTR